MFHGSVFPDFKHVHYAEKFFQKYSKTWNYASPSFARYTRKYRLKSNRHIGFELYLPPVEHWYNTKTHTHFEIAKDQSIIFTELIGDKVVKDATIKQIADAVSEISIKGNKICLSRKLTSEQGEAILIVVASIIEKLFST